MNLQQTGELLLHVVELLEKNNNIEASWVKYSIFSQLKFIWHKFCTCIGIQKQPSFKFPNSPTVHAPKQVKNIASLYIYYASWLRKVTIGLFFKALALYT